jgi:predicted branched-subunit amino acid permease
VFVLNRLKVMRKSFFVYSNLTLNSRNFLYGSSTKEPWSNTFLNACCGLKVNGDRQFSCIMNESGSTSCMDVGIKIYIIIKILVYV